MTNELRVFGGTLFHLVGVGNLQRRHIVAAHSKAEAIRLLQCSRSEFNHGFCVTHNDDEIRAGLNKTGIVLIELTPNTKVFTVRK